MQVPVDSEYGLGDLCVVDGHPGNVKVDGLANLERLFQNARVRVQMGFVSARYVVLYEWEQFLQLFGEEDPES
jgi:hypothetical protein